jgi:hypothetical protein
MGHPGRPSKKSILKRESAARARLSARNFTSVSPAVRILEQPCEASSYPCRALDTNEDFDPENECSWEGGVNHAMPDSEGDWSDDNSLDIEPEADDDEIHELHGEDLLASLQAEQEHLDAVRCKVKAGMYEILARPIRLKEWKEAESKRSLGYNKHSGRTARRHKQAAREKEAEDAITRQS